MSRIRSLFPLLLAGALIQAACQPIVAPPSASQVESNTTPALPIVSVVLETQNIYDVADDTETKEPLPAEARRGDADDPAIWVHPTDPTQSLVIGALKNGGLDVYDLDGQVLQSISPAGVRYNNVDLIYNFPLAGAADNANNAGMVDLAIATDRYTDNLAIFTIDPTSRQLTDVSDPANPLIFTPAGQASDQATTAYGIATYASPDGQFYAFITRRDTGELAQLALSDNGNGQVHYATVRTLTLPPPDGGELADAQLEGMVVDQQLGILYAAQEKVGIWKFAAAPDGSPEGELLHAVRPVGTHLEADAEGLTMLLWPR